MGGVHGIGDPRGAALPAPALQRTTFAELVQRYRDTVIKEARNFSKAVREQHLIWWNDHFTGRTLAEITPDLVAEARDALASETFRRGKVQTNKTASPCRSSGGRQGLYRHP